MIHLNLTVTWHFSENIQRKCVFCHLKLNPPVSSCTQWSDGDNKLILFFLIVTCEHLRPARRGQSRRVVDVNPETRTPCRPPSCSLLRRTPPSGNYQHKHEQMKIPNFPPVRLFQTRPDSHPASLELSILAQMRSVSMGSSFGLVALTWRARDSQGAPVSVDRPSMARPACRAK